MSAVQFCLKPPPLFPYFIPIFLKFLKGCVISLFIQGFLVSFSLIVAVGAQNIYLLKKALLREQALLIASICFVIDASLIISGVKGTGKILELYPSFFRYISWFGIIFLIFYGLIALGGAFKAEKIQIEAKIDKRRGIGKTILSTLAISLLNPHVYLDTMMLIGSVGSRFRGMEQNLFIFGATSASFVWFFSLAYGSRILIPLFKKPLTWKILDITTAFVMFCVAYSLFQAI